MLAIVDLGSNSARLVLYREVAEGGLYEADSFKQVLRLSAHLTEDGRLDDEGVAKTMDCMRRFRQLCDARGVTNVIGTATAAVRRATNGQELVRAIREETGLSMRILSGDEEAYYGYLAVANSMKITDAYTVDIGGGSTEVTLMKGRQLLKRVSFPFGAVTLTQQFFKSEVPTESELEQLETYLYGQFLTAPWLREHRIPLVGIGGGARNVGNMHQKKVKYPLQSLHHYTLPAADVADQYRTLAKLPVKQRRKVKGLSGDRADIIVASLAVFKVLLAVTGSSNFITSNKGLRDGLVFEHVRQGQASPLLEDVRMYSTRQLMGRFYVNQELAEVTARLVLSLFDQFRAAGLLQAGEEERNLLESAALLHDVGRAINSFETHQHTHYLLTSVLVMGLTHRERLILAMIASHKNEKKLDKLLQSAEGIIPKEAWGNVRRLALLLRTVRAADPFKTGQVREMRLELGAGGSRIVCEGVGKNFVEEASGEEIRERYAEVYGHPILLVSS